MTKKDILKFLEKFNDSDEIMIDGQRSFSDCKFRQCENCQYYRDGECYKLFEAVSVHCDCEGPIDGLRVDKDFCCNFYVPNSEL